MTLVITGWNKRSFSSYRDTLNLLNFFCLVNGMNVLKGRLDIRVQRQLP